MLSQKIFSVASNGTARKAPATPQIQKKNVRPTKMVDRIQCQAVTEQHRRHEVRLNQVDREKTSGIRSAWPTLSNVVRPATPSTTTPVSAPR